MSKAREITVLTDVSLITCIVQRGVADRIISAAHDAGAQGATVFYARGTGVRERLGLLEPGQRIVEATSGNTGIAFSYFARLKGYEITIVMPENMTDERKEIIRNLDADLVLCSDIIVAGEGARFGYPPARVWGTPTTAMWVYRMGLERAKRYLLTGDEIGAAEAEEIGLILEAVPDEELQSHAMALARRMARRGSSGSHR